jgi:hypothetical protein
MNIENTINNYIDKLVEKQENIDISTLIEKREQEEKKDVIKVINTIEKFLI